MGSSRFHCGLEEQSPGEVEIAEAKVIEYCSNLNADEGQISFNRIVHLFLITQVINSQLYTSKILR